MSAPDNALSRKSRLSVPIGGGSEHNSSSSSLPTSSSSRRTTTNSHSSSSLTIHHYLSRATFDFHMMDMQSALDQMKSLLSIRRPQVVYKTAYYRKQTKNHWARDDPAFCVLLGMLLMVSSIAYSVAFKASISTSLLFMFHSVVMNWLLLGVILSTILQQIANRSLTTKLPTMHVQQSVEWLYAFDIHNNAFFVVFVLLYGVEFFLLPILLNKSFVSLWLANTLYAAAFSWYWYITHLGYRALPFLSNTEVFLFPIAAILLVYVLNLVGYPLGLGWNAARIMAKLYFA